MNYSKKHLKYYYTFCITLFLIYFSVLFFSLFLQCPLMTILIGILLYYPLVFSIKCFSIKNFFDILSREKNSRKFYNTVHMHPLRPSLLYRLHAEYYMGNYETLILLSQAGYKTVKSVRMKVTCLVFLAQGYFELHDINKLKEVTDTFFELKKSLPKKEKVFSTCKIFSFYKSFVIEDYTECIEFVDNELIHLNVQKKNELRRLTQQSNYAICLYWKGNKQKAKEIFENFKINTPNLANFNGLADKYLYAIENNDTSALDISLFDNSDKNNFEIQLITTRTREKKKKIIFYSLLLLFLIGFLLLEFMDYKDDINSPSDHENEIIEFENDLKSAVSKNYNNATFVKYFNITDGSLHIDSFCLIEHENGLDLTSIVTYDNGETLDLVVLIENLQIPYDYSVKSAVTDNQIAFHISSEQQSTTSNNEIIEFTSDNKDYWIEITSITPLN